MSSLRRQIQENLPDTLRKAGESALETIQTVRSLIRRGLPHNSLAMEEVYARSLLQSWQGIEDANAQYAEQLRLAYGNRIRRAVAHIQRRNGAHRCPPVFAENHCSQMPELHGS